ncbi:hypothetical protein SERLA73DRAFT_188087 [Serpula lacrymans var. lacrymans S7.3]|uniref:Nucleoside phosphorylase domain-containing protein n=2 Tax=Serpula lacrymans var. lacrymans TaxID=341189 RepID=F8QBS7_SERL3|nr:uncharacterized protein SERLADRAFT_478056 [Serpula lacrymans var. lacrymans S7.9]EGN94288.1 hypothetical protein SERLA73DRAFT_188087 [Serpula lacrymans var. lacrymans S7.3]EGO19777.1 hypothetical protein SERLADRAFT_478056 [Serpula lacrymans var. lacrymans S7.9]
MKDLLTDANFPKTADGRVYHLGIRAGEVANRIVTVGSISRANGIASLLDPVPKPFSLYSERGFLTITGRYKTVPLSIICIGMGGPNVDFFIREVRECIVGDMLVIRLGSCGCLTDLPVGSLVVPKASIAVTRNLDFDFVAGNSVNTNTAYRFSKAAYADPELHIGLWKALEGTRPASSQTAIASDVMNASADSFYSSQGRQTSFPDHNYDLIERLKDTVPELVSLEMETFYIFHLASSWHGRRIPAPSMPPPLATGPVTPAITSPAPPSEPSIPIEGSAKATNSRIRAAAVHMVFASRTSQDFISPIQVSEIEKWSGRGVLEALRAFDVPTDNLHPEKGTVWALH